MTRQPESATRKRVRELSAAGVTPREIAAALRISTQAVYKHLKALNLNGKRAS